jgi:hypothetical protein
MDDQTLVMWKDLEERISRHAPMYDALREYVQSFFIDAVGTICAEKGWPAPQYMIRPPLGLRLEAQGDGRPMTVALRPGWRPAKKYYAWADKQDEPGVVRTDKVEVEVLGEEEEKRKPLLLHLDLYDGKEPSLRRLCNDQAQRAAAVRALECKARDLLADPLSLFSEQKETCCCCGKRLTDPVSRIRGIGPECIRFFGCWSLKPPNAVERYRQEYLETLLKP